MQRDSANKVLITGVAGFIGSNLLDYLLDETDWHVDGIDNFSTGSAENIAHRIGNGRFNFMHKQCSEVASLKPYSCIFHLAALPRIQPSFELVNQHIHANLNESVHLMELMIQEKHFPKFVYSGSSAIYGTPVHIPTDENERVDCLSPYAFQKYEVERYLEILSTRYPFNYVTLRYFNPYGPRSFNPDNKFNAYSSVVGIFLNRKKSGLPLLVTGDGSQKRDFVHVKDLASANHLAALSEDGLNTSFNIGRGNTISILELAHKISDDIQFIPKREGEAHVTFALIDKAKRILGWNPVCDLDAYLESELVASPKQTMIKP